MGLAQVFAQCQGRNCQAQSRTVQTETGFNSAGAPGDGHSLGLLGCEQPLGAAHEALEGFLETSTQTSLM